LAERGEEAGMKIAFLGLGNMGGPVAGRLLKAGHELTVWNRSADKAQGLATEGAAIAQNPQAAVKAAQVVFTMLNDDEAVKRVVLGSDEQQGIVKALHPGTVHVSLSTISVRLSRELTAKHAEAGSEFVAAPVFGRPNVAAEGKLWIVAGGKSDAVGRVRPLLEQISRGITVVSEEPWRAHALKIGGNFLITAMIESLSEAMVFAEGEGIDPALFCETVNNALFRSPLYEAYSKVMLNPPEHPGATIALGAKDMGLFRQAAEGTGMKTPLADHFARDLATAAEAGLKDRDWAAGLYQLARNASLAER
jgi:3-hydroxyisobutyrate dehydrogenase-like beta-hydroxyacid dehydrogenase